MAYALLTHTSKAGTGTAVTTDAIDTSGATLLIVAIGDYNSISQSSVTDSKVGNTWTGLTVQADGINSRCRIWYAKNPVVGSGHTFTYSGNSNFPAMAVAAFSGADTTAPFDQENGATGNGITSRTTGSVTPANANELLVAAICFDAVNTMAIDLSFAITDQTNFGAGLNFGIALAYLIETTAAAKNPNWTWGSSAGAAAVIGTFIAGAGGGSSTATTWLMRA